MPLTSITIENFKGIAAPVTIPIRPITLLFGKNSAGKSTVLHALHYLREVLEHRRPDADRTQVGGDAIDLGGFQAMVHRNELDRRIRIQVAFSLDDDGIPNNGITSPGGETEQSQSLSIDLNSVVKLESAWVEAATAWEEGKGAYIAEYAVGLNGDEIIRLRQSSGLHPEVLSVNFDHAIVRELDRQYAQETDDKLSERMFGLYIDVEDPYADTVSWSPVPLNEQDSIIPDPYKPFLVDDDFTNDSIYQDPETQFPFWSIVGQALTGPLAVLLRELCSIRYLGPIREVPPRNHRSPKTPNESRWSCGLGAWDALVRDASLVEKTSDYLQDTLKLGYSIRREERISIDASGEVMAALRLLAAQYEEKDAGFLRQLILDPLERLPRQPVIQLHDQVNNIDVDPSDIGVGVSQVLPVIVGALDAGASDRPCRIFAVEQPELHVHPAVQVALGDVFIDAVTGTERTMLIETHSEHLLLRLLRRVRETGGHESETDFRTITADDLSVVYVRPTDKGMALTPLAVTEDGDFEEPWPEGFFDERDSELF